MLHFEKSVINISIEFAYDPKVKNTKVVIIMTICIYKWNQRMWISQRQRLYRISCI